jgi:hypothetical protein
MRLNGGPQNDLAPRVEFAVENPRSGLEIRNGKPQIVLPFFLLRYPVIESSARPVHRPLPSWLACQK